MVYSKLRFFSTSKLGTVYFFGWPDRQNSKYICKLFDSTRIFSSLPLSHRFWFVYRSWKAINHLRTSQISISVPVFKFRNDILFRLPFQKKLIAAFCSFSTIISTLYKNIYRITKHSVATPYLQRTATKYSKSVTVIYGSSKINK